MAWTTPRDWTTGEFVTEAMMDTHIRDNLNAIYSVSKMKAVDETVNNSTTLQNDDDLFFTIAASEKWTVEIVCKIVSNATPDFKVFFTAPAGATFNFVTLQSVGTVALVPWASTAQSIITDATATGNIGIVKAYVINSTTAGTVNFQWAQNTAEASNTILKAGSFMIANRCV
jgi:hypothetical protein